MYKGPIKSVMNQPVNDTLLSNDMYNWAKKSAAKQTNLNSITSSIEAVQDENSSLDNITLNNVVITSPDTGDMTKQMNTSKEDNSSYLSLSKEKVKEAIVWSEILGKPMCKRRKRR